MLTAAHRRSVFFSPTRISRACNGSAELRTSEVAVPHIRNFLLGVGPGSQEDPANTCMLCLERPAYCYCFTNHEQRREVVYLGGLITRRSLVRIQPLLPLSSARIASTRECQRRGQCAALEPLSTPSPIPPAAPPAESAATPTDHHSSLGGEAAGFAGCASVRRGSL
jgi:hypothetical protein